VNRWALIALMAAALALIAAVAWLSHAVIHAERERSAAEIERLALWRLDARATALIVAEVARDTDWGVPAASPERAAGPAPLAARWESGVSVAEEPAFAAKAAPGWSAQPANPGDRADHAVRALNVAAGAAPMAARLESAVAVEDHAAFAGEAAPSRSIQPATLGDRADYASRSANVAAAQQRSLPVAMREAAATDADEADRQRASAEPESAAATILARWQDGRLVLARQRGASEEILPIAWPTLEAELLAIVADVLPEARLVPAEPDGALRLAALPVTLVPGRLPPVELSEATRWTLIGAWLVAVAGLGGTVALVVSAIQLAQRRATFVSAVTHELRTPLTALRLHGDLLADDRVASDPQRRAGRIAVIRSEAERLAHLIDNVLDYARLERRRPPQPGPLSLAELLTPLLPRLAERLGTVALILETAAMPSVTVRCDPAAVERILLNLVDNAAKYAASASDRRVELRARQSGKRVVLVVRDHGPGLAADARDRLFVPFARSAEAAAGSAPGTGLGLALSRRLARAQGGDLRHQPTAVGCAMELSLPLA
jgi:signal transduction histidine kinase